MIKERVVETNVGIQDSCIVEEFDLFQKQMRDRGWMETDEIIATGIRRGHVLEIGSGPGYLGLEWLKKTDATELTALEISREMINRSRKNAELYSLVERCSYVHGNAIAMPFEENAFESAFSNGSLHEWEQPVSVLNEIYRVLKPGGLFYISDLRRDIHPLVKWIMKSSAEGRNMKEGFETSYRASYSREEILHILEQSGFIEYEVKSRFFGMAITGKKQENG